MDKKNNSNNNDFSFFSFSIFMVVVVVIGVLYNGIHFINEGERAVVTSFGEISKTWDPGMHFSFPFVQDVDRYSVRIQKATFGRLNDRDSVHDVLSAYSNDQQVIESYRISITWQYDASRISEVYKEFGKSDDNNSIFYTVVSPLVQQTSKQILGQFTANTIVQERTKLDRSLDESLKNLLSAYPIKVIGVQMEDINFSRNYENVIEQNAQKKMEIEKAKNELLRIEIESKQAIAKAESENKAIKLKADAQAYQIETLAKAEANAIRLKAEALKDNKELVELTIAERWNGTVPQTVFTGEGSKSMVPIMNLN